MQFVNIYSYETIIKLVKEMIYIGIIYFEDNFMTISEMIAVHEYSDVEENAKH